MDYTCATWSDVVDHLPDTDRWYPLMDVIDDACAGKPLTETVKISLTPEEAEAVNAALLSEE